MAKRGAKGAKGAKGAAVRPKVRGANGAPKAGGKFVYMFGRKTDGNGQMKPLLGGKGANLAEMCRIGLPVPPGFTITTEVCTYYYDHKRSYPPALKAQMQAGIAAIHHCRRGACHGHSGSRALNRCRPHCARRRDRVDAALPGRG